MNEVVFARGIGALVAALSRGDQGPSEETAEFWTTWILGESEAGDPTYGVDTEHPDAEGFLERMRSQTEDERRGRKAAKIAMAAAKAEEEDA